MTQETLPPKLYTRGVIGRKADIEREFAKYNVSNPCDYKFNDPTCLYYINKQNQIAQALGDSDLYYVITNSDDWTEIHLKQKKRKRKFIVTINEGSPTCNGCEFTSKCTDELKRKCKLGELLNELVDGPVMAGKTIQIEEVTE